MAGADSGGRTLVAQTELRAGALKYPEVLMQSITLIAPGIALLFTFQFAVGLAGIVTPLAFIITFLIVATLAYCLAVLARAFPSAGGYITYISRGLHPRIGWYAGWLFIFYTPIVAAPILAYMGRILEDSLKAQYGFTFPWWLFFLLGFLLTSVLVYFGIKLSGRALVTLGLIEIVIVSVLAIWGLFSPGPGGLNASPFDPSKIHFHGIYLAVVFTIFAYTGWEGAAPLAEESENPSRIVPRALIGAIIFQLIFMTVGSYGLMIGWGTNKLTSLTASTEIPPITLAHHFWHGAWVIVILALLNSTIAVVIASVNVSSRMWYSMARAGALPKTFAKIHPKHKTPVNALYAQFAITLIVLGLFYWWFTEQNIWFVQGLASTFVLIVIYGLANAAVTVYFWRERRSEFNWFKHGVVPLVGVAALVILFYKSLVPFPTYPAKWAPVMAGVWALIGFVLLAVLYARRKEQWLDKMREAVAQVEVAAAEPEGPANVRGALIDPKEDA